MTAALKPFELQVEHIFSASDRNADSGLDEEEVAWLVRSCNPETALTEDQIQLIVEEIWASFSQHITAHGLTREGLRSLYVSGLADIEHDYRLMCEHAAEQQAAAGRVGWDTPTVTVPYRTPALDVLSIRKSQLQRSTLPGTGPTASYRSMTAAGAAGPPATTAKTLSWTATKTNPPSPTAAQGSVRTSESSTGMIPALAAGALAVGAIAAVATPAAVAVTATPVAVVTVPPAAVATATPAAVATATPAAVATAMPAVAIATAAPGATDVNPRPPPFAVGINPRASLSSSTARPGLDAGAFAATPGFNLDSPGTSDLLSGTCGAAELASVRLAMAEICTPGLPHMRAPVTDARSLQVAASGDGNPGSGSNNRSQSPTESLRSVGTGNGPCFLRSSVSQPSNNTALAPPEIVSPLESAVAAVKDDAPTACLHGQEPLASTTVAPASNVKPSERCTSTQHTPGLAMAASCAAVASALAVGCASATPTQVVHVETESAPQHDWLHLGVSSPASSQATAAAHLTRPTGTPGLQGSSLAGSGPDVFAGVQTPAPPRVPRLVPGFTPGLRSAARSRPALPPVLIHVALLDACADGFSGDSLVSALQESAPEGCVVRLERTAPLAEGGVVARVSICLAGADDPEAALEEAQYLGVVLRIDPGQVLSGLLFGRVVVVKDLPGESHVAGPDAASSVERPAATPEAEVRTVLARANDAEPAVPCSPLHTGANSSESASLARQGTASQHDVVPDDTGSAHVVVPPTCSPPCSTQQTEIPGTATPPQQQPIPVDNNTTASPQWTPAREENLEEDVFASIPATAVRARARGVDGAALLEREEVELAATMSVVVASSVASPAFVSSARPPGTSSPGQAAQRSSPVLAAQEDHAAFPPGALSSSVAGASMSPVHVPAPLSPALQLPPTPLSPATSSRSVAAAQPTALQPRPALAHFRAGNGLFASGRYEEASGEYWQGVFCCEAVGPTETPLCVKTHVNLGITLEAQGLLLAACERYEAAAKLDPRHYRAFKLLGSARYALGDFEAARRALEASLALKHDYADALCDLGCTLCALGEVEAAKSRFRAAAAAEPGHVEARFNMGNLHRQCGELGRAVACYDCVLALDPGHWRSLLNKAVVQTCQGGTDAGTEAAANLRAALRLSGRGSALAREVDQLKAMLAAGADWNSVGQMMSHISDKAARMAGAAPVGRRSSARRGRGDDDAGACSVSKPVLPKAGVESKTQTDLGQATPSRSPVRALASMVARAVSRTSKNAAPSSSCAATSVTAPAHETTTTPRTLSWRGRDRNAAARAALARLGLDLGRLAAEVDVPALQQLAPLTCVPPANIKALLRDEGSGGSLEPRPSTQNTHSLDAIGMTAAEALVRRLLPELSADLFQHLMRTIYAQVFSLLDPKGTGTLDGIDLLAVLCALSKGRGSERLAAAHAVLSWKQPITAGVARRYVAQLRLVFSAAHDYEEFKRRRDGVDAETTQDPVGYLDATAFTTYVRAQFRHHDALPILCQPLE